MYLCLLQIADSALPISGYTHSWGLEAAIARGLVHGAESLERWVRHWLATSLGLLEGVLVASGCRVARAGNSAEMPALNRLAEVSIMPPSTRRASREMGDQLMMLGSTWGWCAAGLAPFRQAQTESGDGWHHLGRARPAWDPGGRRAYGCVGGLLPSGSSGYDRRRGSRDPRRPYTRPASAGLSPKRHPQPGRGTGGSRTPSPPKRGLPFLRDSLCDEQTRLYARMFRS